MKRGGAISEERYAEQGRRLRLLRKAEGIETAMSFAARMGWAQSGMSQFETGKRQLPGFDPLWIWEGDKRGLSFDLRQRIEAEEAKDAA
jgi:transcriptional regulator with XRE-family HTH domain